MTMETVLDRVASFLGQPTLLHCIGDRSSRSISGQQCEIINPSDGALLCTAALGGEKEIDDAVKAAKSAQPIWADKRVEERSGLLHRLADRLEDESEILVQLESLDVGKAISDARTFDIPFGIECIRYYAHLCVSAETITPLAVEKFNSRVIRKPYGVCGFIFPWNFPFDLMMWGIMPALAAGNAVVVKPSELTPLSTLYVANLAREIGFPAGLINVVMGEGLTAGAALAKHPEIKRMSFTGSPEVGMNIGASCGQNLVPVKLELGGKGAAVIFDDVDIEKTAEALCNTITFNSGQVCCTATRWIVHESIYDDFLDSAVACLKNTKIGPGMDPTTQMGPLVSEQHRQRVEQMLYKGLNSSNGGSATFIMEGRHVAVDGYEGGFYFSPTLQTGSTENICYQKEIFGPCAFLRKFRDENSAIDEVNSLTYGLANSVWSSDLARADRVAEKMVAGNSWINGHNILAYGLPYGGCHLSGMGGGVNSPEAYFDYLRNQTVVRPL